MPSTHLSPSLNLIIIDMAMQLVGKSSSLQNPGHTSLLLMYVVLVVLCLLLITLMIGVVESISGKRKRASLDRQLVNDLGASVLIAVPFFFGVFLFKHAIASQSGNIPA